MAHKLTGHLLSGTDEELAERQTNFDDHLKTQRDRRKQQHDQKADLEEELLSVRKAQSDLRAEQGQLAAEAKVSSPFLTFAKTALTML